MNFNASSYKSENLHFNVLLSSITYKVLAEKVQMNHLSWHWKKDPNFEEKLTFFWKMTWRIWLTLARALESLKIFTLVDYFCRKYVIFELKIYRGVVS